MKDTATGKMTGIFVEALERAAENMGLKVQWTEEVGWGAQIEGLQAGRYDIVGSPVWANPTRGKLTTLSIPLYYSGIGAWVRSNDSRFDNGLGGINSEEIQIATIDGETGDLIARTQFPLAKRHSLPQLTDISQLFLEVTNKKADLLFAEPFYGFKFLESNPGLLKNVAIEHPIKVLGNCYMMKLNEPLLKNALDVSLQDLLGSGYIDGLLNKYEPFPNTFYRAANPYKSFK
jgi:ABC-type amino acid transport substrate-binding protein